jgi:hypothetical protein
MAKVGTLRNIIALFSFIFLLSCKNEHDDFVNGQWQVQSVSSDNSYIPDMGNQNYSLNVSETGNGSSVNVSDRSGEMDEAAIRYKSGDHMIVEYTNPQTGEKVLVQMKKN